MTSAPALPCPSCQRVLRPESWHDEHGGSCFFCKTDFEFFGYPALRASRTQIAPQAAVLAAESVCYFHAENRAEAICDGCGRLLCPVCAVPFAGQKLCPSCIAASKSAELPAAVRERVLYDRIALGLAFFPLLIWPMTLLTAPVTIGFVFYGWKKPGSLVLGPGRGRLVAAAIVAVLEIVGWVVLGGSTLWLRHRH